MNIYKNRQNRHESVMKNFPRIAVLVAAICLFLLFQVLFPAVSSLKGQVKEKESGTPLADVKISLSVLNKAGSRYTLESDKEGNFFKTGLINGVYQLSIMKEGYVPVQTTVRLQVGKQQEIAISLEKMKTPETKGAFRLIKTAQDLMAKGKYTDAISKISEALKENPSSFLLYFNRGVAYEKKGDITNASTDYKKTAELKPDFIPVLAALGKLAAKESDFESAAAHYKKAFDLGITDTVALYNYGACLVNLGKNDEAKTVFEKLIRLDPNYTDAYYQLGIVLVGANDTAKAKEYLKKFLELDPQNANAEVAKEILKSL